MIKAIAFDLGGVLSAEGKSVAIERLERERGYKPGEVRKILTSPQSIDMRKGLMADSEFWAWAQAQLPPGYDAREIKAAWYDGYELDLGILDLIQRLKGRYKVVAFSGNIRSRVEFLEERYRFRRLLDVEVYSFDHHLTKPDKKFVEIMIEKAGCRPEEIVYIEDNDRYAEPARELGVKVVLYTRGENEKLLAELKIMGVEI